MKTAGAGRFFRSPGQVRWATVTRRFFGVPGQSGRRGGARAFATEDFDPGTGSRERRFCLTAAGLQIEPSLPAGFGRGFAGAGRRQLYSGAAGHGKADGDGLFRRARTMVSLSNMTNLFANKFTGLGGRRLALALVASRAFDG